MFDQAFVVGLGQLRVDGFLDVADVFARTKIFVDEPVHIAELELDGGPDAVEAHDAGKVIHDALSALEAAPVVVGQFQHEQAIKEAFSFFVVVHQYFSLNDLYEMGGGSVRQRVQR